MTIKNTTSPPPGEILNGIMAARQVGDREMERRGREILARDHGIRIAFTRGKRSPAQPATPTEVAAK